MPVDPVVSSDGGAIATVDMNAEIAAEYHHKPMRVWGSDGSPGEDTAVVATVTAPFVAISGDGTWGTATPIKGVDDVPALASDTRFAPHTLLVVDSDHITPYRFRIIWGTGTSAEAITAHQWSETMFMNTAGPFNAGVPVRIKAPALVTATKLWVQVWNATNLSEVDFYWGCHGHT